MQVPRANQHPILQVVISGNRPESSHFNAYPSFIRFDGVLSQEYTPAELKRIAMLSDNMADYVHGKTITNNEWRRPQAVVKKAHAAKKTVRFWGAPDNMDMWQTLMSLQVDYINTDHINALGQFLRGDTVAEVGKRLPAWRQGYLDLHHINTGRGNAAYYIFPCKGLTDFGTYSVIQSELEQAGTIHKYHSFKWLKGSFSKVGLKLSTYGTTKVQALDSANSVEKDKRVDMNNKHSTSCSDINRIANSFLIEQLSTKAAFEKQLQSAWHLIVDADKEAICASAL